MKFSNHLAIAALGLALAVGEPASAAKPLVEIAPAQPLPDNYREDMQRLIPRMLRDPESARFDFQSPPYLMICKKQTWKNLAPMEVWAVEVMVNGRNGYGGYAGFTPYTVIFVPSSDPTVPQMLYAYEGANAGILSYVGRCKKKE